MLHQFTVLVWFMITPTGQAINPNVFQFNSAADCNVAISQLQNGGNTNPGSNLVCRPFRIRDQTVVKTPNS